MRIPGSLKKPYALVLAAIFLQFISPINSEIAAADVLPINMGVAGQFSLLAPTITMGGAISVYSAIGALSASSATGEATVTDPTVAKHFGDATYTAAMADLTSAISGAFSDTLTAKPATVLDAQTFVPGRYYFTAQEVTPSANAVITLDASSNPDGVYIFLFPGNFTPGATVHVMGNADPTKVFWVVRGNFTLGGASAIWQGNVLAGGNITLGNTDILIGRVLSLTSVTTDADQILPGLRKPYFTISPSIETATVGSPITPVRMSNREVTGVTYSISPALPAGISLNSGTGEITGTPTESQTATLYTITALRETLIATQNLKLTVYPAVKLSAPTITSVVPPSGSTSGGETLTIVGTDFRSGATVSVGGRSCTVSSFTDIEIVCQTSSGLSGSVDVVVTNNDGGAATASNKFTFVAPGDTPQSALSLTVVSGSAGSPISLSMLGGSGSGAVTYTVASGGSASDCAVDRETLTSTSFGTCLVTATKAGSSVISGESTIYYSAISSPVVSFSFAARSQVTLRITSTNGTLGNQLHLTTTGGSGVISVTYAVTSGGAYGCEETSGNLIFTSAGICRVTATNLANGNYASVSSVQTDITIVNLNPVLAIAFSDETLKPATVGDPYSDNLIARTYSDILIDSHDITYALAFGSPALPVGLVLNATTGFVTGTIESTVSPGTINLLFTASSPGYTPKTTTTASYLIVKAAAEVSTGFTFGGSSTSPPVLSIEFTDQTLKDATVGMAYSDYLAARTLSNGSPDSHDITYALAFGSPALPVGLVLNATTGFVTGTIESTVSPGTINLLFTASSPGGYTSVTTTLLSDLVVVAAAIVPGEVLVALAINIGYSQLANEPSSETSSTKEPVQSSKKLMMTALFANNSSILSKAQISEIEVLSAALLKMSIQTITVVGFVNTAPGAGNKTLAIARAKTLAKYLKLNRIDQKITIKSDVTPVTKANKSAISLIAMRKAEIWVVLNNDQAKE